MNQLPALRVQAFHERLRTLGYTYDQISEVIVALEETIEDDIRRIGGVPCPTDGCDRLMRHEEGAFHRGYRKCPEHGFVDGPFDLLIAFPPVTARTGN